MITKITSLKMREVKNLFAFKLALIMMVLCVTNANAQLLQWNTFGNSGTETTEPSIANDANIGGPVNLTQGSITAAANGNRFGGSGWFNAGNTVGGNTLTEAIAGDDFIQFIITPNPGFSFTATSLVFTWDRSSTGPSNVTLRSSADGFATDLGSVTGMASGGSATTTPRTITITALSNITAATTFRLYGYGATATGGTGGFDNASSIVDVQLNGTTAAACVTPVLAINSTTPTCTATTNGAIDLSVSSGTPAFTYSWSNGASTEDISNLAAATYTVTVTGSDGCTATTSATVNPIALPTVSFSGLPATTCINSGVLTLTGNQAPAGTFTGNGITDNADGTAAFNPGSATVGGPYSITYSYTDISTGCSNSETQTITVNDAPNIGAITAVSNTCPTVSFDLNSIVLSNSGAAGATTYFSLLNDAINNTNPISSTVNVTGTYYVRVTTVAGCFDVDSVAVTITGCGCANPPTSNAGIDFTSCANVSATLNGSIGGGATSATWTGGAGTFNPDANTLNATYTPTPTELLAGFVMLTLTTDDPDAAGPCIAAFSSVTITFLEAPTVGVSPSLTTICTGSSTGNLIANGAIAYTWSPDNGSLNTTTGAAVIATPIINTTYTVTGTGANGCFNTANVTVNLNALPAINTDISTTAICNGAATGAITASGGVSYEWLPAQGLNTTSGTSIIASPIITTTYTVTGTDGNGCSATATVEVTVNQNPVITITGNAYACAGSSTVLDAGFGFTSYLWSTASTEQTISVMTNGTFTVTVTDANGCSNADSKQVTITAAPTATAVVTESTCNTNIPGTIDLTATGGTPCNKNAKGLIISKVSSNPTGNDSPLEFVELVATKDIDFSATPYTVIFTNNGTTGTAGWLTGGNVTYAFLINTGTAVAGGVYYVGGDQMPVGGNRLRTINTGTTGGDGGIGSAAIGGVLGNGGANADAVAVFDLPVASITSSSVPLDAIFFGSGIGASAIAGGTQGYQLPTNEFYSGGKLVAGSFLLPDDFSASNIIIEATGTYDVQNNNFSTPRTFAANSLFFFNEGVSTISLANTQAYFFNWSNAATTEDLANLTAGTYTVTVTDCNGCSVTLSKTVLNVASPVADFTGLPAMVCANATAITLIGNQAPFGTFTGSGITDNLDGTATFDAATAGAGGPYSITYSFTEPSTGCTGSQSYSIMVNGLPDIQTISAVTNNCPSPTVDLSALILVNNGVAGTTSFFGTLADANNNVNTISPVVNITNTYYIRVTTANGCYDVEPVTVTISGCGCANPATASAGTNFSICANASALLNGSIGGGATSLIWSGGTGSFSPNNTTANATYTPSPTEITAGSVTLTLTTNDPDDAGICVAVSSTVTVTINTLPTIILDSDSTAICFGSTSGTITASGAMAYSWSPALGLNVTTGTSVIANPGTSTVYTVTGTNSNGCTNSTTLIVTVNNLPALDIQPAQPAICFGSSTSLDVTGALTYTWADGSGLNTTTGMSVIANPTTTTTYTVTGIDANGCSATTSVEVLVNPLPTVTISGGTIICNGSATTLSAGNGFASYLWSNGDTNESIATAIAGTYTVTVTDGNGCSNSASITMSVSNPPTLSATATAATCNANTPGSITLNVSGGAPCASNSTGLIISKVLANPVGTDSPYEFVELVATKNIDFSVTPYSVIFANNGTATANGWKAGGAITYGFEISSGTAVAGGVYYVGGNAMIPVANRLRAINTGTTAGDGGLGNANSTGVLGNGGTVDGVAVFNSNIASITSSSVPTDAFFFGTSIGAALVSGGTQGYQLPNNDLYSGGKLQTTSYFGPDPVTPQYCIATGVYNAITNTFTTARSFANNATLSEGVSDVTVITAASYTYSWSNGMTTQNISGLIAGTYTVTVTDCNGCSSTLSQTVANTPSPTPTISGALAFCDGSSTTLSTESYPDYLWSTGETTQSIVVTTSATFTVTVTDVNGCSATASVATTNNPLPVPVIAGQGLPCNGNPAYLDAGSYASYLWSDGATTQIIATTSIGTYTVTVTNANGCTGSASYTVTFAGTAPSKPVSMSGSFTANCILLNMVYSCPPVANATSYFWTVPVGVKIIAGQGTNSITVNYTPAYTAKNGVITVAAVNSCGMSAAYKRQTSSRLNTPVISGMNSMCPGDIKTYTATPIAGALSYTWTKVAGSTILSGQGTTTVTIKWGAVGGLIKCSANNACGASIVGNFGVSLTCTKLANNTFDFTEISLYPNPASTAATLQFDALADGKGVLEVYDMVGQMVWSSTLNVQTGDNQFVLDLNAFPKGIYSIKVGYNGMVRNKKLVIR